jgi:hypothetical protein
MTLKLVIPACRGFIHTVMRHLKGGIVEPEEVAIARQRLSKRASTATDHMQQ